MDLEEYRKNKLSIKNQENVITADHTELKKILKHMINEFMIKYFSTK